MTTLSIRNLTDTTQTTELVRDVTHSHPQWVHEQLGTGGLESAIQSILDTCDVQEFIDAAAKRPDETAYCLDTGIYYAGPLYRLESTYEHAGTTVLDDSAESLGDAYGRHYADEDEAQASADRLTEDQDEDTETPWNYRVVEVRSAVHCAIMDAVKDTEGNTDWCEPPMGEADLNAIGLKLYP